MAGIAGAIAYGVLVACGAPSARGVRVEFFPGPVDPRLQAAAQDAVVRVLERSGATLAMASWPFDVRALLTLECEGHRLRVDLGFTRSDGPQSLSVRLCRADGAAPGLCPDGAEERPTGACRDRVDGLLSAMERDLADHLLGKVQFASADHLRWWDGPWPWSVLSLLSPRRWASRIEDPWSWRARAALVAGAGPGGSRAPGVALDGRRSTAATTSVRGSIAAVTSDRDVERR